MNADTSAGPEATEPSLGSGLVIDVDRHTSGAVLFDVVEKHGRFVAGSSTQSTLSPPIADPSVAVHRLLREISEQTGRSLLDEQSVSPRVADRQAPDIMVLTGQPVAATRLAILSTGEHPTIASLTAVARSTTTIVRLLDEQARNEDGVLSGTKLELMLRTFQPDVAILVAGERAQLEWPTAVGTLHDLMHDGVVQQLIVLGSEQLQQQVAQVMGEDANLTGLDPSHFTVDEVASAVELELHTLYESRVADEAGGLAPEPTIFVNRGRAGDLVTRFLARRREQAVIAATISEGTLINWSNISASRCVNRPDVDVHGQATAALGLDARRIGQFLPFSMSTEDLRHWILNRAIRPTAVADTRRDQLIECAVASALLRSMWLDIESVASSDTGLIVGGPLFARWYSPGLGVLALLNAFQPAPSGGVVEVVLDADGILLAAGAVGESNPALAADVVEHDLMMPAASVIVVEGSGAEGDLAVSGRIEYEDGETTDFTVPYGSVHVAPLGDGESAALTMTCESGFSIGGSAAGETVEFGGSRPLRGGPLGVVVDARGRPVVSASDPSIDTSRVASWFADLGIPHAMA